MRWALFVFCACETAALGLLAQGLADAVASSPVGFAWRHATAALLLLTAGVAAVRAWPRWWAALHWRCTAVLAAADGKGPLRVRLEGPGVVHDTVVSACWQAGGAAALRLVAMAPGMPGAILLPWQAASAEMARRLQRAARVALRVQPETPERERFC